MNGRQALGFVGYQEGRNPRGFECDGDGFGAAGVALMEPRFACRGFRLSAVRVQLPDFDVKAGNNTMKECLDRKTATPNVGV